MSNEDLKEFVEIQFKYMNEKIDNNHRHSSEMQNNTLAQATKTNGRLGRLEVKVWEIEKEGNGHITNCPNTGKIKALEDENLEIRVIKKYPKVVFGILVFLVCVSLFGVLFGYNKIGSELDTIKARQQIILNEEQSLMRK